MSSLQIAGGSVTAREVDDHGDAVTVLPYHSDRRDALLACQNGAPAFVAARLVPKLEAWAGRLGDLNTAACKAREAPEECGSVLGDFEGEDDITCFEDVHRR